MYGAIEGNLWYLEKKEENKTDFTLTFKVL